MDLKDLGGALLRRWYLTALVIVMALSSGWGAMQVIGVKFTAVSTAVLIPPPSTFQNAARTSHYAPPNPLLYLSGLTQSRDVFIRKLLSQAVVDRVDEAVPGASYEVSSDPTSSGPLVIVTSESHTADGALTVLKVIDDQMKPLLANLQKELDIAKSNQISLITLTVDDTPKANRKSQLQFSMVSAAAVFSVGLLLIGFLDGFIGARRAGGGLRSRDDGAPEGRPARRGRHASSTRAALRSRAEGRDRSEPSYSHDGQPSMLVGHSDQGPD